MKAGWYEKTGPARDVLTIGTMDDPNPKDGEVVVRLAYSGVNPSDVKTRAGARGRMSWPRTIPHSDGSGTIIDVGTGISRDRIGEQVWTWNAAWQRPFGTAAEYVALPAAQAVTLPDGADMQGAALMGIQGLTAHRAVYCNGSVAGKNVLVTGGAGTVGRYAIQMAKLGGAIVTTTVSSTDKATIAKSAGADHIINYREGDTATAIMDATGGKGIDHIVEVEFGGNLDVSNKVLRLNSHIATYGSMEVPEPALAFYPMMFNCTSITMIAVYLLTDDARQHGQHDLTTWLGDGSLTHNIHNIYDLDNIADAHEAVEDSSRTGSVLIKTS